MPSPSTWLIFTRDVRIKVRTTRYSCPRQPKRWRVKALSSNGEGLVGCSNITIVTLHEYFALATHGHDPSFSMLSSSNPVHSQSSVYPDLRMHP